MKICEEISPTDFSCQTNWNLIARLFEVNGGLSRMCGNTQVRFLEEKGAERLPTYSTIKKEMIL
jgi:hypothetical protein